MHGIMVDLVYVLSCYILDNKYPVLIFITGRDNGEDIIGTNVFFILPTCYFLCIIFMLDQYRSRVLVVSVESRQWLFFQRPNFLKHL